MEKQNRKFQQQRMVSLMMSIIIYYYYYYYYFPFTTIFPGEPGSGGFPVGPPPQPVLKENLWVLVKTGFIWTGCPSSHSTISIKVLKGTQSTDCNQWPGLILSSSMTEKKSIVPFKQAC